MKNHNIIRCITFLCLIGFASYAWSQFVGSYEWLRDPEARQRQYRESARAHREILEEKERTRSVRPSTPAGRAADEGAELARDRAISGTITAARRGSQARSGFVGTLLDHEKANPNPDVHRYPHAHGEALRELEHEPKRQRALDEMAQRRGHRSFRDMTTPSLEEQIAASQRGPTIGAPREGGGMKYFKTVDEAREWALNTGYPDIPVLYEDKKTGEIGVIEIESTDFLESGGRCRNFRNVWLQQGDLYTDRRSACSYGDLNLDWSVDGTVIAEESSNQTGGDSIEEELRRLVEDVDRGSRRLETDVTRSQYDRSSFDAALGAVDRAATNLEQDNTRRVVDGTYAMTSSVTSAAAREALQRAQEQSRVRQDRSRNLGQVSRGAPGTTPKRRTCKTYCWGPRREIRDPGGCNTVCQ